VEQVLEQRTIDARFLQQRGATGSDQKISAIAPPIA